MIVEKCNRRRACLCTAVGLIDRFARCFRDSRSKEVIEHKVATMVGQRIFGIALGHEDSPLPLPAIENRIRRHEMP